MCMYKTLFHPLSKVSFQASRIHRSKTTHSPKNGHLQGPSKSPEVLPLAPWKQRKEYGLKTFAQHCISHFIRSKLQRDLTGGNVAINKLH